MKLKRCPFCGGKPEEVNIDQPNHWAWLIRCSECGAQGPADRSVLMAAQWWNGRAETPE